MVPIRTKSKENKSFPKIRKSKTTEQTSRIYFATSISLVSTSCATSLVSRVPKLYAPLPSVLVSIKFFDGVIRYEKNLLRACSDCTGEKEYICKQRLFSEKNLNEQLQ